jgi:hypothetical protein
MSDHGDQWVTAEIDVQGAKLIRHLIEGDSVLECTEPQSDEGDAHAKALAAKQGTMLQRETISLQSEVTRSNPAKSRSWTSPSDGPIRQTVTSVCLGLPAGPSDDSSSALLLPFLKNRIPNPGYDPTRPR